MRNVRGIRNRPPDKGDYRGLYPSTFIPYDKNLLTRASALRQNLTPFMNLIWYKILKVPPLDQYKFIRQKPLLNYIVDFYCSMLMLVIEIDGDSHAEQPEYDDRRTLELESYGIEVIRYANSDFLTELEGIFQDLQERIQKRVEYLKRK